MPATIAITNVTPYSLPQYSSFRSPINSPPTEGPRVVPVSFDWQKDAVAPNYAVEINLANQPQLRFSQICSIYVDNTQSDADTFFYFPDTQCRVTVPANTEALLPVSTNGVRMIAYAPSAVDDDSTWVQLFNYYPAPVALEKSQFTSPESAVAIALPTTVTPTNTTIYTGPGTIRSAYISINSAVASAADILQVQLLDGVAGSALFVTAFGITTTAASAILFQMSGLEIPFTNGVVLNLTDEAGHILAGGTLYANIYVSHK
jgi:hypothetical protein